MYANYNLIQSHSAVLILIARFAHGQPFSMLSIRRVTILSPANQTLNPTAIAEEQLGIDTQCIYYQLYQQG